LFVIAEEGIIMLATTWFAALSVVLEHEQIATAMTMSIISPWPTVKDTIAELPITLAAHVGPEVRFQRILDLDPNMLHW
jgi:predicted anti-sigma-YlaC factor YlaD